MIVVTGTGRSGTSMWMQALTAAGLPFIGQKFPGKFRERLGKANPRGFFESKMRDLGVPSDADPEAYRHHVVKLFPIAMARTDPRHLHRVICTMRRVDEFASSAARLRGMSSDGPVSPEKLEAQWWRANHGLIMDAWRRGYPFRVLTYDATLADPEKSVAETLAWLSVPDLDVAKAAQAIAPEMRTQSRPERPSTDIDPRDRATFDDLYDAATSGRPLTAALVTKMAATDGRMRARFGKKRVNHG